MFSSKIKQAKIRTSNRTVIISALLSTKIIIFIYLLKLSEKQTKNVLNNEKKVNKEKEGGPRGGFIKPKISFFLSIESHHFI